MNINQYAHHPVMIEAYKKIETKLSYPHKLSERIEELEKLKSNFRQDPNMVDFIKRVIEKFQGWDEEQYSRYAEATATNISKWKVQTKTSDDNQSVEVSAVIEGSHGEISWGWHDGESKIVVLRVASLYQKCPVDQSIIDAAEAIAYNICVEKNSAN